MSHLRPATRGGVVVTALTAVFCAGVGTGVTLHPGALPPAVAGAVALGLLLGAGCSRSRPWLGAAVAAAVLGLGLWRGATAVPPRHPSAAGPTTLAGVVRDAPTVRRGETLVVVDVAEVAALGERLGAVIIAVPGRLDLGPGDAVEVEAAGLRSAGSPGGPLSAEALDRGGIDAVATSPRVTLVRRGDPSPARLVAGVRASVSGAIDRALPEPEASLLDAVAFGIRGPLPAELDRPLRDAGLIHLASTSGLKVAIVSATVARLLALVAAGPRARRLTTVAVTGVYVVVAGGGAAATRSALTGSVAAGLGGGGRRADPLPLLGSVAALLLALDPRMVLDVGFQLTVLGTLGILGMAGPIARRIPGPRLLAEPFAVTLAAQAVTLPIAAGTFGVVSVVGPVANALALPLVPAMIVLAWAGVALGAVCPVLGWPALQAAALPTRGVEVIAELGARIPGAAWHVAGWPAAWTVAELVSLVGAGAVLAAAGRHRRSGGTGSPRGRAGSCRPPSRGGMAVAAAAVAALGGGGALVLGAAPDARLHVVVLPAGAGPAVLARTPEGGTVLVDAGSDPTRLLDSVGAALPVGAGAIDQLVLTGGERAAVAGLADLTTHYRVGRVVVPDADLGNAARTAVLALVDSGTSVVTVPLGMAWSWGGLGWRCLDPGPPDPAGVAGPLCALQVGGGSAGSALLLGDLAPAGQDQLAALGGTLASDLLVAPPSGALSPALLRAVQPREVAVPGTRPPRLLAPGATAPEGVRSTATGGPLSYATGPDGRLEPG